MYSNDNNMSFTTAWVFHSFHSTTLCVCVCVCAEVGEFSESGAGCCGCGGVERERRQRTRELKICFFERFYLAKKTFFNQEKSKKTFLTKGFSQIKNRKKHNKANTSIWQVSLKNTRSTWQQLHSLTTRTQLLLPTKRWKISVIAIKDLKIGLLSISQKKTVQDILHTTFLNQGNMGTCKGALREFGHNHRKKILNNEGQLGMI